MILFFLLAFNLFSSESEGNKIFWSPATELTWQDFKGWPDSTTNHTSLSCIGMTVTINFNKKKDSIIVESKSYFRTDLSWVKDAASNNLLQHEKLHFDIEEIYCRQLKKELMDCEFAYKTFNHEVDSICNVLYNEAADLQDEYDAETNHGMNPSAQSEWEKLIADELLNLSDADIEKVYVKINF